MKTNKLFILPVEPLETRYTSQLRNHLPTELQIKLANKFNIILVDGIQTINTPTEGAFLNFIDTNIYKSSQLIELLKHTISDGDIIFALDAWNPTIIQLRYILDLMNIKAKIAGMWHSGSYDPADFLGRLIDNKHWSYNFERSLYHAIDYNFFATQFHIDMFIQTIKPYQRDIEQQLYYDKGDYKYARTGLPLTFLEDELLPYKDIEKENIILFPHRIAPEKQPEIFRDLAKSMPKYKFVFAQEQKLTKHEYHTLIAKSKIVFSANLQETLGISPYEGIILNAVPLLPNRLSYEEMYPSNFLYPSNWTLNFNTYLENKDKVIDIIEHAMTHYDEYKALMPNLKDDLSDRFFSLDNIVEIFEKSKI